MPTPLKIIIHAHIFREIVVLHSLRDQTANFIPYKVILHLT